MLRTRFLQFAAAFLLTGTTTLFAAKTVTIFEPEMLPQTHLNATEARLTEDGKAVEFTATTKGYPWPGPVWRGNWNLDGCTQLAIEIENPESFPISFAVRIDDPAAQQNNANWFTASFKAPANSKTTQIVALPNVFPKQLQGLVEGMRGLPGGAKTSSASLDWRDVRAVFIFMEKPQKPVRFRISRVTAVEGSERRLTANWMKMTPEEFFPMIDRYGQFRYEDWPGKIHSDAEFAERIAAEKADQTANPRPKNWDSFGGWLDGPTLKATGHFRTEKVDGKWWLVSPEGHLFWSHGVDCVGDGGSTPVSFREHYFEELPKESPFYGTGSSHIGFYQNKGSFRAFNWTASNLLRKYGENYLKLNAENAHARLASWAMNSIGNWSSSDIYGMNRTPYVVTLRAAGRSIEGSQGYWGKFPDPFTDEFRKTIHDSIAHNLERLQSPYCIGAFTNNEMSWGDEFSLARAALASPADQPAKLEFVKHLQTKYESIEKLNAAWKTSYANWDALTNASEVPQNPELNGDLGEFYSIIADQYFRVVHEELRAAVPNTLDLGCRFAWTNDRAARAMAGFVDVMSYNRYVETLQDFTLPEGIDLPVIIGEFHFGALDRGIFHTGLRGAKDQNERAQKYYAYVRSALENPLIVGTHWFQYCAQPTTGRFDGENYQIGLVDLGDTPYPETIAKVREIGRSMYEIRSKNAK